MIDNTGARRSTNRRNAQVLAMLGVAVFPSSGKVPLIPRFNQLDTTISPEEREAAAAEFREKNDGKDPIHVGATKDPETVKRMWRAHRDAVPSIACGPSGLVVLDADQKDNGPELMDALFEQNGGVPAGAPVLPTKSGGKHFVFADPDGTYTNRAGLLKKNYGTDVRGTGGQFVAPGSIREDGKTYGTEKDLAAFCRAIKDATIPTLPSFVTELIGAAGEAPEGENVTPTKEREVITALRDTDWPDFDEVFDATLGKYDLDELRAEDAEFAKLYDHPSADCSTNRFLAARSVMRQWPEMLPEELAVFFEQWEGAGQITDDKPTSGEYDLRQIAREWIKNQGLSKPSSGDAFGAVVDEDEDPEYEREIAEEKAREKAAASKRGTLSFMSTLAVYHDPDYLIENIATTGMVGMLHAPSNAGKTFSVFHLAGCLSEGWPWFGRNVEQSGVLYCYGEGHSGMSRRALAWRERYQPKLDALIFRDGIPNFALDPKNARKALKKAVTDANKMLEERGLKPIRFVALDTFAKAVAGAEENSTREMQPILNMLRELAVELDVCILIVHHSGKDSSLGARGASAIFADVDFNLEIVGEAEAKKRKVSIKPGNMALVMPKMRDSGKGGRFEFRLEEVRLGTNKWGNPVTSMVVVETKEGSDGAAMGVVDEEAQNTEDELTPDQNRAAEQSRLDLCAAILKAVREHGKLIDGRNIAAPVQAVVKVIPALVKLKEKHGSNFARALRKDVFEGEPRTLLAEGWLHYVPATGKKDSTFLFKPR